ncbi:uncharacterized protein LOC119721289 [Patiria miniata]|uniref:Uncharacterized protein n=1 Tax=Patiria miniata TaxID=46514 RepID=A0A913Z886_PATMI|nr:uncharacterized protein LOC119721289 [Patiria miniata]
MSTASRGNQRLLDSESAYPWYSGTADHELLERSDSGPAARDDRKLAAKPSRWPWFIWLLLKLIGLYNHRPAVARRRQCLQCRLTAAEMRCVIRGEGVPEYLYPGACPSEDEEGPEGGEPRAINAQPTVREEAGNGEEETGFLVRDDPCLVCRSEWWDAYGRYRPYTEEDIGVTRWNHRGSAALSVIWLILVIVPNMVAFLPYLVNYWGNDDRKVDLVIYSGFMLFVVHVPVLCLAANVTNMLRDWQRQCRSYAWTNALGIQYIIKRLQHLDLRERGLPYKAFLLVCLVWPLFNSLWRVVVYYVPFEYIHSPIINISLVSCTVGMQIWGAFCYLVVLMRLSFQRQFEMELAFLRKHRGILGRCRRRLTLFMEDFGSLGSLSTIWIMFSIAVATWSIATQVYYDYATYDSRHNQTTQPFQTNKELDLLIWSEISMFLLLPLVAVGGLDLNGLWVRFRRHVGEMRLGGREGNCDAFCDQILAYCNEHPPVRNIETITLLVSALGLCLAIEFKERDDFDILHTNHHT